MYIVLGNKIFKIRAPQAKLRRDHCQCWNLLCLLLLVSGLGKWGQSRIWRACMTRKVAHKVCPGKNGHGFGSIRDCRTKLDTQSFSTERDHKGNCAVSQKSTASWRYFTKLKVKVLTAIRAWTPIQEKKVGSFGPNLPWLVLPTGQQLRMLNI